MHRTDTNIGVGDTAAHGCMPFDHDLLQHQSWGCCVPCAGACTTFEAAAQSCQSSAKITRAASCGQGTIQSFSLMVVQDRKQQPCSGCLLRTARSPAAAVVQTLPQKIAPLSLWCSPIIRARPDTPLQGARGLSRTPCQGHLARFERRHTRFERHHTACFMHNIFSWPALHGQLARPFTSLLRACLVTTPLTCSPCKVPHCARYPE